MTLILYFNDAKYIVTKDLALVTDKGQVVFHEGDLINVTKVYPNLLRIGDKKSALYLDEQQSQEFMKYLSEFEVIEFEEGPEFKMTESKVDLNTLTESEDTSVIVDKLIVTNVITTLE